MRENRVDDCTKQWAERRRDGLRGDGKDLGISDGEGREGCGARMTDQSDAEGLRARGEEALGELAQALLENPVVNGALGKALGAGERAASAQRGAMSALNFASSAEVERLEQRLRSLSMRLEAIEDRLDDLAPPLRGAGPGR